MILLHSSKLLLIDLSKWRYITTCKWVLNILWLPFRVNGIERLIGLFIKLKLTRDEATLFNSGYSG